MVTQLAATQREQAVVSRHQQEELQDQNKHGMQVIEYASDPYPLLGWEGLVPGRCLHLFLLPGVGRRSRHQRELETRSRRQRDLVHRRRAV